MLITTTKRENNEHKLPHIYWCKVNKRKNIIQKIVSTHEIIVIKEPTTVKDTEDESNANVPFCSALIEAVISRLFLQNKKRICFYF